MRIAVCVLAVLAITVSSSPISKGGGKTVLAASVQSGSPQITAVRLNGKKLFVAGDGFDIGAAILIDGERQKTANDESDPTTLLIARKAGKRIGSTDIVTIQVINANTQQSASVRFFGGPTITQADEGLTVKLSVHQQFLIALESFYDWSLDFSDPGAFLAVPVQLPVLGTQGIFQAQAAGDYTLTAKGDPGCRKLTPPCEIPSSLVEVRLVVR